MKIIVQSNSTIWLFVRLLLIAFVRDHYWYPELRIITAAMYSYKIHEENFSFQHSIDKKLKRDRTSFVFQQCSVMFRIVRNSEFN